MSDNRSISATRKLLYLFIIAILVPLMLLLSLELAGRLYIYFEYGVQGKSYGLWRYDSELGAVHSENAYNTNAETNNYGFRNRENVIEPKPEGAYRIIAYGGSTTYCYNLSNNEAWPLQLQKLLRDKHNSLDQVLNGGAILWSLGHAYARAQRELAILKPDYVILYSGINEEANANALSLQGRKLSTALERGEFGLFATNYDQNRWIKRNSVVVRFIDYWIQPRLAEWLNSNKRNGGYNSKIEPRNVDKIVLENYILTLRSFLDLIKKVGAQPIFIIQANGHDNNTVERITNYSRLAVPVARAAGATIIDAQEVVNSYSGPPTDLFSSTGVHWSALGARDFAYYIWKKSFDVALSHSS